MYTEHMLSIINIIAVSNVIEAMSKKSCPITAQTENPAIMNVNSIFL